MIPSFDSFKIRKQTLSVNTRFPLCIIGIIFSNFDLIPTIKKFHCGENVNSVAYKSYINISCEKNEHDSGNCFILKISEE
jgi:hypothetical protein